MKADAHIILTQLIHCKKGPKVPYRGPLYQSRRLFCVEETDTLPDVCEPALRENKEYQHVLLHVSMCPISVIVIPA